MAVDWLSILQIPVEWVLRKLSGKYAQHKASEKAIRGEDLASQGSLEHLVKKELERLAAGDKLPPDLQSEQCRIWLRQGTNVELFVEAVIARAGNLADMSKLAEVRLAAEFERITGDTRKLALGPIALAVSHVYGHLTATEEGRQALHIALDFRNAAQLEWLHRPDSQEVPNEERLGRARAMATLLLEAGKRSWKMPRFVAPLTLEAHVRQDDREEYQDDHEPNPINPSELSSAIEAGENFVLFGAGGVGKTTFLLELCASCMNDGRRIPLFVDAAVWARTNASLFEYLASLPSAQGKGVTPLELTKLAQAGRLVIMLNGWNEMSATSKLVCREGLIQLAAAAAALNVVVVSRTSDDSPGLQDAKRVEVRGLTWQGQSAVVRAELGSDGATSLVDLLARDTRLRHAARSPLILRGLFAQSRAGVVADSSVFDLLGAAVRAFEEDDQRHHVLCDAPVAGHQRIYLEELACLLTQRLATNCSRDDALQAIHSAATQLADRRLIGALPQLTSVLDVLVNHHLLHLDDDVVRFAHQRFQEYFAATRLLRECIGDGVTPAFLCAAVNQPAWEESLVLVADKLSREAQPAARVRLLKAAAPIDLGLACDLAGICAFSDADDLELHRHLVARVNELTASPLEEVRDLGVAYQIASGWPVFADDLLALLESDDQQVRLHTYRLNGSAISLAQFGPGAEQRVASWPSDRRVELVREIADNEDNYEFLVGLVRGEPVAAVRAAAISALFWHFPASDVPLQAWLTAPIEVQTDRNVMSQIQSALGDAYAGDAVRERLQTIVLNGTSESAQLQLALAFPDEVGPLAMDAVFRRLCDSQHRGDDTRLLALARTHAPERLLELARELALQGRIAPEWVGNYLLAAPARIKTEIFERAWTALQGPDFKNLRPEFLGPLANRSQTERSIASWLEHTEASRASPTEIDLERHRQRESLLKHAPGGELLSVVMRRAQRASYDESVQLLELIHRRIGGDYGSAGTANVWLPTLDEVRQLVAVFNEKGETAEVPQDTVRVYLCCIASHVAPAEFGQFFLETCRRHLDAWSIFRERVDRWSKARTSPRPQNPHLSFYLISALARWGSDALPGLVALVVHPSAMEFIPTAIARIVGLPWASKRESLFSSVSTDIQEGEQRRRLGRELRQPDDTYQHWTDEAAKALGQKLRELVEAYERERSADEKWNAREAEYRVGRLAGAVASIPSAGVVEPVSRALASGLTDIWGTVGALRGLVRQGLTISDEAVIRQLETFHEQVANANWHDDSLRNAISQLSELLFCAVPTPLLRKPQGHYLQQWCRFSWPNEVIRALGALRSEAAWPALLELRRQLAESRQPPEELAGALISALRPRYFAEFLDLVADGTLLSGCSEWTLERLAPSIAAVIGGGASEVEALLAACRRAPSRFGDVLAGSVLSHIKGSEETRQCFLLEALDAGRALQPSMPAYRMLLDMFTFRVHVDQGMYELSPKARNELRMQLYARARGSGTIADGCRRLLASVELWRREAGRPDDELRHPTPEDGFAWTDALLGWQMNH